MRVPGARAWLAGGGQERGARGGAVQGVAFARSTGGAGQFRLDEMRSVAEIPATIHQGFNATSNFLQSLQPLVLNGSPTCSYLPRENLMMSHT